MGGSIWGACGARACGAGACLLRADLSCVALPMGGRYHRDTAGPLGREASRRGTLQMESPGRGAMYPGIPPKEVLRGVTPPEEAVPLYPGVCSATWLHEVGGAD